VPGGRSRSGWRKTGPAARVDLDELKVLAARIGSAGVLALLASAGEQALGDGKWRKLRVYWRRGGWPARRAVDGIRRMEGGGTAAAGGRERSGAADRQQQQGNQVFSLDQVRCI